jgi:hypothetical protein
MGRYAGASHDSSKCSEGGRVIGLVGPTDTVTGSVRVIIATYGLRRPLARHVTVMSLAQPKGVHLRVS